jgi:hypothetical protein
MLTYKYLGRRGRLGNQMFQYATLYSVAKTNGYDYGIPYHTKSEDDYMDMCLLDCFKNISAKNCQLVMPKKQIQEQNNLFMPSLMQIEDDTDIFGYFQTEKYFKQFKKELLHEFTFKDEILNKVKSLKNQIKSEIISVHMRFGDYEMFTDVYPRPTEQYYLEAFAPLPKNANIILFSDNLDKASKFFNKLNKKFIIFEGLTKYQDMCFMSLCDYHILANSSFSWWGAWLSNSKKVIAPKNWYGPSSNAPKQWHDIYCEGWELV